MERCEGRERTSTYLRENTGLAIVDITRKETRQASETYVQGRTWAWRARQEAVNWFLLEDVAEERAQRHGV